jgi:hypothetical protein
MAEQHWSDKPPVKLTEDTKYTLTIYDDVTERQREVTIHVTNGALFLEVEGYTNEYGNPAISIDLFQDILSVFLWADRETETYTHKISLEPMRIVKDRLVPRGYKTPAIDRPDEIDMKRTTRTI